jgi:hypothetical protein
MNDLGITTMSLMQRSAVIGITVVALSSLLLGLCLLYAIMEVEPKPKELHHRDD